MLQNLISRIPESGLPRYAALCAVSLTGTLILFFMQWILEGSWLLQDQHRVVRMSAQYLPVPFMFMLWLHAIEQAAGKFTLRFSPIMLGLAIYGFSAIEIFSSKPNLGQFAVAIGVYSSLFIFVPVRDCISRMISHPRLALVLVLGASSAILYYLLMMTIWGPVCQWTTELVYYILRLFSSEIDTWVHPHSEYSFYVKSPHFSLLINPGCNGLEGIFLFMCMLSATLLLDWPLFKDILLMPLYALGVVLMFFVNAIRISLIFLIGHASGHPDAWAWVKDLKDAPVYLFHSYAGWFIYIVVFALFANWLYATSRPSSQSK